MDRETVPSFFFHHLDFIFRDNSNKILSFPDNDKGHNVSIYFNLAGNDMVSLSRSPFGGFIFRNEVHKSEAVHLAQQVISWARTNTVQSIVIRCFPQIYSHGLGLLTEEALLQTGFTLKYEDITQALNVNTPALEMVNTHRRRRLRKCLEAGFVFRKLSAVHLPEAYLLFAESRGHKGYPVTMTLPELTKMFEQFSENYILFGVFDNERMIAAAVCIVVNSEILYCFYLGDSLGSRPFSPVTFLVSEIYDFCSSANFRLLDLGISTDRGVLNEGLYSFKRSFGCIDSRKLTFEKRI